MTKTNELKKNLQELFETLTTNVFAEDADKDTPYPYLVFETQELFNVDNKTVYELEVNLLDYGVSTRAIDTLADDMQKLLHQYYFIDEKIQFTVYKINKNTVKEEDKKIRRRRLTFEIQLHESIGG